MIQKILALMILALLAGCQGMGASADQEVFKIGVMGPFSGPTARYGEAMQAGYDLALEDIKLDPALKDIKFELVYGDARCDNKEAKNEAERLFAFEQVDFMLGPYCDGTNVMVSYSAQQHDKVVLSPSGVSSKHVGIGHNYFRLQLENKVELRYLIDYIKEHTKHRKFGIIFVNNDFGFEYSELMQEYLTEIGGEVVFNDGYEVIEQDFRNSISKIKELKPDAVYIVNSDFGTGRILKQIDEFGIDIPVYGCLNSQSVKMHEIAQDAAQGLIFVLNDDVNLLPRQQAFHRRLKESDYPQNGWVEPNAYDAMMLAVKVLNACGSEVDCQRNFLQNLQNYEGVSGTIDFTSGDINKSMIVKQYVDGEYIQIG